jgi:phospholipid N-methyltransferase
MKLERKYFGRDLEAMSWAKNYNKWILDEIKDYIGSNILEVGAGAGNFSDFVLSLSIKKLTCMEPSKNMFSLLKKKFVNNNKIVLKNGGIKNIIGDKKNERFDTILYINVLENIEKG